MRTASTPARTGSARAARTRARYAALDQVWTAATVEVARNAYGALAWQARAACGARTDLPWTADPDQVGPWDAETMRTVCAACPVLAECSTYATTNQVTAGWWAGTHRDPTYAPLPRPGWARLATTTEGVRVWQGTLPLDRPA